MLPVGNGLRQDSTIVPDRNVWPPLNDFINVINVSGILTGCLCDDGPRSRERSLTPGLSPAHGREEEEHRGGGRYSVRFGRRAVRRVRRLHTQRVYTKWATSKGSRG